MIIATMITDTNAITIIFVKPGFEDKKYILLIKRFNYLRPKVVFLSGIMIEKNSSRHKIWVNTSSFLSPKTFKQKLSMTRKKLAKTTKKGKDDCCRYLGLGSNQASRWVSVGDFCVPSMVFAIDEQWGKPRFGG
jgi:hypothetical protein